MRKFTFFCLCICSGLAWAELPKPVEIELTREAEKYEKLYPQKRGKEIYGYVNQKVIENLVEQTGMPELLGSMEHLLVQLVQNRKIFLKMDLSNAQSDMSQSGVAYAIIPYVMNIDGSSVKGEMLAIKDGHKWTFSRFEADNSIMKKAVQNVYPDLKLP